MMIQSLYPTPFFEFENHNFKFKIVYSSGIFKKNNPLTMSPRPIY